MVDIISQISGLCTHLTSLSPEKIPDKLFASSDERPFLHGSACQRRPQQLRAQRGGDPQVVWAWDAQDTAALHASAAHARHQGHDRRRDRAELKDCKRGKGWTFCLATGLFLMPLCWMFPRGWVEIYWQFVVLLHHVFMLLPGTVLWGGFFYFFIIFSRCIATSSQLRGLVWWELAFCDSFDSVLKRLGPPE